MRLRSLILMCIGTVFVALPVAAQEAENSLQDPFLNDLAGTWTMSGHVMGDSVEYDADGKWVLGRQFLRLRMEDVHSPPEYVARVFIGYDPKAQEYVAHWLDSSGGRPSKTLGYGRKEGRAIEFSFEYPEGPFRTTFQQKPEEGWHVLIRSKGDDGEWSTFAEYDMVPR